MRKRSPILLDLFLTFAKIGCFTFGGGYAMISVITDTCVEKKGWISHDEMMTVTVIAESTPGPIAINCATYVGYKLAGMPGAVFATLGIVLPSFFIIYLISVCLDHFLDHPLVTKAFQGMKVGVGILILDAGITMLKKMQKTPRSRIIAAFGFVAMLLISLFALNISSIVLMLTAGTISLCLFITKRTSEQRGGGAK